MRYVEGGMVRKIFCPSFSVQAEQGKGLAILCVCWNNSEMRRALTWQSSVGNWNSHSMFSWSFGSIGTNLPLSFYEGEGRKFLDAHLQQKQEQKMARILFAVQCIALHYVGGSHDIGQVGGGEKKRCNRGDKGRGFQPKVPQT